MSISRTDAPPIDLARSVRVSEERLVVELTDGREISIPLDWYPRLAHGTIEERGNWQLIGRTRGTSSDTHDYR
jgi:hypothetical protein